MTTEATLAAHKVTIREAVVEGVREELLRDPDVLLIGQDIGKFGGPLQCTAGLYDEFGAERVVETPICESSMMSMALGAAAMGLRPVVDIMFSDMLPLVAVPLIQTAGYFRHVTVGKGQLPVVVRTRGGDGPYRAHPQNYEALFAHSPGLVIVQPSTPRDAKGLIKAAIRSNDPVVFLENIYLYNAFKDEVGGDDELVPLGRGRVRRQGRDVTVVAYGRAIRTLVAAASACEQEGISLEVIDLRTLSPWDEPLVRESVAKTGRLLVVHEAWTQGGLGSEIVSRILATSFADLKAAPKRIGAPAVPLPWAPELRDALIPSAAAIQEAARDLVGR